MGSQVEEQNGGAAEAPAAAEGLAAPGLEVSESQSRSSEAEDDDVRGGVVGPAPEKAAKALEVARGLAENMGLETEVSVRDEHERIVIVLGEKEGSTAVADILGASRPPAIPSFQFLLNKIVNRFPEGRKHILVEVPSVPRRVVERKPKAPAQAQAPQQGQVAVPHQPRELDPDLDPVLVEVGRLLAERARAIGKVITVHPMAPGDRRTVHQTVMTMQGVSTMSVGDGLYRRMHIVPDSLRGAGTGTGRRRRRRRRRRGGEAGEGAPRPGQDGQDADLLDSDGDGGEGGDDGAHPEPAVEARATDVQV